MVRVDDGILRNYGRTELKFRETGGFGRVVEAPAEAARKLIRIKWKSDQNRKQF